MTILKVNQLSNLMEVVTPSQAVEHAIERHSSGLGGEAALAKKIQKQTKILGALIEKLHEQGQFNDLDVVDLCSASEIRYALAQD